MFWSHFIPLSCGYCCQCKSLLSWQHLGTNWRATNCLQKEKYREFCKGKANLLPPFPSKPTSFLTTACTEICELGAHISSLTCWAPWTSPGRVVGVCVVPGDAQCLCVQGMTGAQCPGCSQWQGYGLASCYSQGPQSCPNLPAFDPGAALQVMSVSPSLASGQRWSPTTAARHGKSSTVLQVRDMPPAFSNSLLSGTNWREGASTGSEMCPAQCGAPCLQL